MKTNNFIVKHESRLSLPKINSSITGNFKSGKEIKDHLKKNIKKLIELQAKLYASDKYSLLLIFQGMDAAGKDGTIKHVMSGLNPQGTNVHSFKQPSAEELDHGYLWRISKALPERGRIGIFNRSHYEEVLVVRVHDLVKNQKLPAPFVNDKIWKNRYREINDFEKYLFENGTLILKFFLHISKDEQKKRFLERINDPAKNWKFSEADLNERKFWEKYLHAYEEALEATSKKHAPWYIIPADHKWFMRLLVSDIIVEALENLKLNFPKLGSAQLKKLEENRKKLLSEK